MVDIATLGIAVDSRDAKTAAGDLDKLTQAGAKTETAMNKTAVAAKKAAADVNSIGNSAKQTAFAMRQLPMQMTDIVTGLTTGQSPFYVLMQQGGQLKDVFGGIVPAARAVGGYVAGLANPFTIAAAAVGVLALAYKQGSDEQTAFAKSVITTGNYAGVTTGQLADMASAIDDQVGTTHEAAAALAQLVGTGRIYGDQLQELAQSAIAWERATGTAVEDTVKVFTELAKDPVQASAKLNETMHYLTLSVYEQIKALQDQGRVQDAAVVAEKAYATALDDRSKEIEKSLGLIESGWKDVKSFAAEAWDAMLGVGRESTLDEQLHKLYLLREFASDAGNQNTVSNLNQQIDAINAQKLLQEGNARMWAEDRRVQQEGISAESAIAKLRDESLSNAEKREKAIADYRQNIEKIRLANPDSSLLDPSKINRDIQNIKDKFKDPEFKLGLFDQARVDMDNWAQKAMRSTDIIQQISKDNEEYIGRLEKGTEAARASAADTEEFLKKDEQRLAESYQRRLDMLNTAHDQGIVSEEKYQQLKLGLEKKYSDESGAVSDNYWVRYAAAAKKSLTNFDELARSTLETFSRGFGDAFEKVIYDSESLGDAFNNLLDGMARATVNAIGQMTAQWLALQAVQLFSGKSAQLSAASTLTANAQATSMQAGLASFASTAAIPIVGPALAPEAMAAALAVTEPMVSAIAATALSGVAHAGMDSIPREGTWLLNGGERIVAPQQNKDLTQFLSSQQKGSAPIVNLYEDKSRAGQVSNRQQEGRDVIDIFVADIMGDGKTQQAISRKFGMGGVGR